MCYLTFILNKLIEVDNNSLSTRCDGHTGLNDRAMVFVQPKLVRAGQEDQGSVFLSVAQANLVNKPFTI